ncbi:MAG TPA: hypothetical protein P5287_07335, partial [bacterium]|nr:hypothetical protein [bacterium]
IIFGASIFGVYMTSQRFLFSGMAQAQAVADARPSLERIKRVVRACTTDPMPTVSGGGNTLLFSEDLNHDPYNQNLVNRSLTYGPGPDGSYATTDDNTLTYVPDTAQPNVQMVLTRHVSQVVTSAGATLPVFTINGTTIQINYRVRYRYALSTTQPVDMSISVVPRN